MTPVLYGSFDKFIRGMEKMNSNSDEPELVKKFKANGDEEVSSSHAQKADENSSLEETIAYRAQRATRLKTFDSLPAPDQAKIMKETNFVWVFNTYK